MTECACFLPDVIFVCLVSVGVFWGGRRCSDKGSKT